MIKITTTLVSIILLFSVCFVLNSCSKDDNDNHIEEENYAEATLPEVAYQYQIVEASFSEPLVQEEYDGTLGDVPLKLVRAAEQTLLFSVPGTVPEGEIVFRIPAVNVSQKLTVKKTELQADESEVLAPLFEQTSAEVQGISDPEYVTYMTEVNTALNDYYQSLSAEEKKDMALFYQVNAAYLGEMLNVDTHGIASRMSSAKGMSEMTTRYQAKSIASTAELVVKFSAAAYLFVAGSTALTLPGTPVEKAVIGAIAVGGAIKAWDYGKQLVSEVNIVNGITQDMLADLSSKMTLNKAARNNDAAPLAFVHDQSKSVNLFTKQQKMTSADRSGTASSLVTFFDAYDVLTTTTGTVNDVIAFINDHLFFANISKIPVYELPDHTEVETVALTEEIFGNLEFSIADSRVHIAGMNFDNGAVNLKIMVDDPAEVTEDIIQTQLNYTYSDGFSSIAGDIPVEVKLEESFVYEGVWIMSFYEVSDNSLFQENRITFNTDGVSTLYEVRTPAHPDPYYHNWLETPEIYTISYDNKMLKATNTAWGVSRYFSVESVHDNVFNLDPAHHNPQADGVDVILTRQ